MELCFVVCRSSFSLHSTSLRRSATMGPWGSMPPAWPHTLIWYHSITGPHLCSLTPLRGRYSSQTCLFACKEARIRSPCCPDCLRVCYAFPLTAVADRSSAQRPHGPPECHEAVQESPVRAAQPLTRRRDRNRSEFRCLLRLLRLLI